MNRRALAARRRWAVYAIRAGGVLVVIGSVLPWVYVPLAGGSVPVPGLLGWGALTLLAGAWLARRPAWWGGLLAGGVSLFAGWRAFSGLPTAVRAGTLMLEQRIQPPNDLLAQFGLAPITLFNLGLPWSQLRGPGPMTVLLGSCLAVFGGAAVLLSSAQTRALGVCPSCGHRDRFGRTSAFCVACGGPMLAERACPSCHTFAEPGDHFCAVCGAGLAAPAGGDGDSDAGFLRPLS